MAYLIKRIDADNDEPQYFGGREQDRFPSGSDIDHAKWVERDEAIEYDDERTARWGTDFIDEPFEIVEE